MIKANAQAIGFEGNLKGWACGYAKNLLRHFQADACVYDGVKPLFDASTVEYTTAICPATSRGRTCRRRAGMRASCRALLLRD